MSSAPAPTFAPSKCLATRWNRQFYDNAAALTPTLARWHRKAQSVVRFDKDESTYFGLRAVQICSSIHDFEAKTWGKGGDFILDFGIHMVGHVSFQLRAHGKHMDAPCRLRLTFGESPLDVTMGMENVETWISTAWLPDEIVNIDMCPEDLHLPRRYSFRYLRIEILDTSRGYQVSFHDVSCECISAVDPATPIEQYTFQKRILDDIDQVSIMTLRDCMQTVFEDGPRRDRRLWLGDLRLQALANYKTFKNFDLVKRCIYMFASVPREDASIPACVFEKPVFTPSEDYIVDYDALFGVVVCDYVEASEDTTFGLEMWESVLGCVKRALSHVDPDTGVFEEERAEGWKFLDWQPKLDRQAGEHGLLIYCLKAVGRLGRLIGRESPYRRVITQMSDAAQVFLSENETFVSGSSKQVSFAAASWLALSGAFSQNQARIALLNSLRDPNAVKPLTPYSWHYVCDALATVGCEDECVEIIETYWGKMIEAGADTFWEFFDPNDRLGSPYGDVRNNSFCHAWSCTPTYLLRGKLQCEVLQRDATTQLVTMAKLDDSWIEKSLRSYKSG